MHNPHVNRARIRLCCGSLKYNTNVPASSLIGSAWYQAAATTTTTTEEGFANRLFSKSAGVLTWKKRASSGLYK